jgi:hypothetical protein
MMMLLHGVKPDLDREWWVLSLLGKFLNFSSWLVFVSQENMLPDMYLADVAAGKDMQGIPWDWDKMLFGRDQCRNMKMKNCRNYQNLSYTRDDVPDDDVRAVAAEALIPAAAALFRLNNQMMHSIVMLLWDILLDLDDLSPSTSRYFT